MNGKFYIIGVKWLSIFNFDFEFIDEDVVDDDFDDIVFDKFGNIIYTCFKISIVIKRNKENKIMFVYKYKVFKGLFGFVVDLVGNIYVCGYVSNNVYIIL